MEEKGGVAGLGGDTGDPGDVDMGATLPVDEFEVCVEGLAVARSSDREPALHPIEEQGLVALLAVGPANRLAGSWRHEDLGLDPGGRDLGCFHHLSRQDPVLDQEHIRVESSAFVPGAHLTDGPEDLHQLAGGKDTLEGDDIVQLQVFAFGHPDPELEWCGVDGPQHTTDHLLHPAERRPAVGQVEGHLGSPGEPGGVPLQIGGAVPGRLQPGHRGGSPRHRRGMGRGIGGRATRKWRCGHRP